MHTNTRVVQSSRARRPVRQPIAPTVARSNRRVGSRWRPAAAAMLLGCVATAAHADDITDYVHAEIGIGAAHYNTPDGRWQQQGVPGGSNVTSKPPAFSLGFTGPVLSRGKWGVDWHAEYVNLGRAAADCSCTPSDENYNPTSHQYTRKVDAPTAFFTGSGRSQGVALTLETYYWVSGARLGLEAGAYVHRDSWSEDIAGWQLPGSGVPKSMHLEDVYWSVAPVVGASIGNGRFSLSWRHYFMSINSNRRNIPPLWNDSDALEIRVRF